MTALFVYISSSTKYGKKIYAIGSNDKAARLNAGMKYIEITSANIRSFEKVARK